MCFLQNLNLRPNLLAHHNEKKRLSKCMQNKLVTKILLIIINYYHRHRYYYYYVSKDIQMCYVTHSLIYVVHLCGAHPN